MAKKQSSKRNLNLGVAAIVLLFLFTASIAFPKTWNTFFNAIGIPAVTLNEEEFKLGLDLQGGAHLVYDADMSAIDEGERESALEGVRDVIERRVDAFGVAEPLVQTQLGGGNYRIIIELAGIFDVSEAIAQIGETPILEFKIPRETEVLATEDQQSIIDTANITEEASALAVLDRALAGEDFSSLVDEFSIDRSTSLEGGIIENLDNAGPIFGELINQITTENIQPGVINGLYESGSSMHIVNYTERVEDAAIEASHILVCHAESLRCDNDRSKVEAQLLAEEIARDVSVANFAATATEKSDGPSAEDGGSLGLVQRGQMVQDFEDALFAISDGSISGVIETDFGYHIIYRQSSSPIYTYNIAHIEMPWTTILDLIGGDAAWENTELSGEHINQASVAFDPNTGLPYVVMDFNAEGGELFQQLTESRVGEVIAIFLDGEPISIPVVQEAIYGGQATISGNFTLEESKLLAMRLNAGALPVAIDLVSQQTVGPTLGATSLERSLKAAMIGFALVAIFMVAYYRLCGLLAVMALFVYSAINLTLYKWLGVTITLAGIAGFILSIGMAVDANVLIFERLKEELKSGRDLPTAIDEGFRRAWTSIRDGNLTTLIASIVLFSMATSFVKGFALTLAVGIIISMLTAILVTRVFLKWTSSFKVGKSTWLYGVSESQKKSS